MAQKNKKTRTPQIAQIQKKRLSGLSSELIATLLVSEARDLQPNLAIEKYATRARQYSSFL